MNNSGTAISRAAFPNAFRGQCRDAPLAHNASRFEHYASRRSIGSQEFEQLQLLPLVQRFKETFGHQGEFAGGAPADVAFGNDDLIGGRAQCEGAGRLVDDQAGKRLALLCLNGRHLEIGSNDRVGVDDVLEEVTDAVLARAGEFGADAGAVVAETMALGAQLLEVLAAGPG